MRSFVLIAVLVPLLFVGCAKRNVKNTSPARDESANAKASPARNDSKTGKIDEGPNWLTDPRFKKEKDQQSTPAPASVQSSTGKPSWGITPPQGGWQPPNAGVAPMPPVQPPGPGPQPGGFAPAGPMAAPGLPAPPGMGVLQPQPVAPAAVTPTAPAKRVEMADMKEVWIYIENRSGASGKMPSPAEVYAALVKTGSPAAELVKSGAIILTGTTDRESVWAYETQARLQGGLVASQNGVETLTAAELQARLGK